MEETHGKVLVNLKDAGRYESYQTDRRKRSVQLQRNPSAGNVLLRRSLAHLALDRYPLMDWAGHRGGMPAISARFWESFSSVRG